jgi:hypothetical protein
MFLNYISIVEIISVEGIIQLLFFNITLNTYQPNSKDSQSQHFFCLGFDS